FQHDSLDPQSREIRVLKVSSGEDCDAIHCEIRTVNFDENPVYTALSYTWDNGNHNLASIVCKGKTLQVGKNLWDFLREFRRRKAATDVLLWVDAICIDQSNVKERNHQVAQMRDIYTMASSVIVWLGPSSGD
ncbi:HET-domain-containing protein, partial [Ophiobolus disseminans]